MRITVHRPTPRHLVIDDFLDETESRAVWDEVRTLAPRTAAGSVLSGDRSVENRFKKRNRNIWLEDVYPDRTQSPLLTLFRVKLWSAPVLDAFRALDDLLFDYATAANRQATLLSLYGDGDYYDEHVDEFPGIAANLFLCHRPRGFRGGDFLLGEGSPLHPAKERRFTRIPFEHGRLVIFATRSPHFVERVETEGRDVEHARVSVQHWPTYVAAS